MIEKKPIPVELPEGFEEETFDIEIDDPEIMEEEVAVEEQPFSEHSDNLLDFLPEAEVEDAMMDLLDKYREDKSSREEWESSYTEGLDLLGFKREERTTPWAGACGVTHPLLAEAVVMFQSQSIMEIFPAQGPVRVKMLGKETPDKRAQGQRVRNEMNHFLTDKMTEYRSEQELLLFQLAVCGSAFKKVYFDPSLGRPVATFVPAEDFVVAYGASDLMSCPRYTHVMRKYPDEVQRLMSSGFYADMDLKEPANISRADLKDKKEEIVNEGKPITDERHTILEMHVSYTFSVDETPIDAPYIVSIELDSEKVLSIRRNWREGDESFEKRMHFVHYSYVPGMGFYGIGLIHLIGGIAKSSTSVLRQLVDAGTLSNLPGGLKTRGLRVKGDDTPISPGQFRDVDVPAGKISENIAFLPYKEPSNVLFGLMTNLVDEGRRIGSIADMKMADTGAETPVGTTLAILERSTKVMSAVHARMHAALKSEFQILAELIHTYMPPTYSYDTEQEAKRVEDFDGRVDIIPVSDPTSATMAQRQVQYQAALTMAQQSPEIYDLKELHREALGSLGIHGVDKIIPIPDETESLDPIAENMAIITNKPIKVFPHQDHKAHMEVHLNAMKDPRMVDMIEKSTKRDMVMGAFEAHLSEHMALQYRREIEESMGVALPELGKPLPPDIENDVARLTAKASKKVLDMGKKEMQDKIDEEALQDPVAAIAFREQDLKEEEFEHEVKQDKIENELKAEEIDVRREKIEADKEIHGLKSAVDHQNKKEDRKAAKNKAA